MRHPTPGYLQPHDLKQRNAGRIEAVNSSIKLWIEAKLISGFLEIFYTFSLSIFHTGSKRPQRHLNAVAFAETVWQLAHHPAAQ